MASSFQKDLQSWDESPCTALVGTGYSCPVITGWAVMDMVGGTLSYKLHWTQPSLLQTTSNYPTSQLWYRLCWKLCLQTILHDPAYILLISWEWTLDTAYILWIFLEWTLQTILQAYWDTDYTEHFASKPSYQTHPTYYRSPENWKWTLPTYYGSPENGQ